MPSLIDPGPPGPPLGLGDAVAALEAMRFDPDQAGAWHEAAPLLSRLSADRGFLGRLAVDQLAGRGPRPAAFRYGPQVMLLHQGSGDWFLRANLWPAADDPLLRASGRRAFFYDVPHDHDFAFLTIGHHGPGYDSDDWTCEDEPAGLPGEPVALRFAGRHRLAPGRMMLYRPRRDVHDQKPPAAFSVSLNLMSASGRDAWRGQYRYDPARGCVAGRLDVHAIEGLVALAAHVGGGDGRDLVEHVARRHPVDWIRFGAVRALAGAAPDEEARTAILEAAATGDDRVVAPLARRALVDAAAVAQWAATP